jgi:hypothetical protein
MRLGPRSQRAKQGLWSPARTGQCHPHTMGSARVRVLQVATWGRRPTLRAKARAASTSPACASVRGAEEKLGRSGWPRSVLLAVTLMVGTWTLLVLLARRLPPGLLRDLARFVPDCVTTIGRLRRDTRVPRPAKVVDGGRIGGTSSRTAPNMVESSTLAAVIAAVRAARCEAQPIHERPAEHRRQGRPDPIAAPVRPVLTGLPSGHQDEPGTARVVMLFPTDEMTSAPNREKIGTRSATARPRSPPLGSSWTAIPANPLDRPQPQRSLYPREYPASPR